jgi:hypothetical protein
MVVGCSSWWYLGGTRKELIIPEAMIDSFDSKPRVNEVRTTSDECTSGA